LPGQASQFASRLVPSLVGSQNHLVRQPPQVVLFPRDIRHICADDEDLYGSCDTGPAASGKNAQLGIAGRAAGYLQSPRPRQVLVGTGEVCTESGLDDVDAGRSTRPTPSNRGDL